MAVTPLNVAADLKRVWVYYDADLDNYPVVYESRLWKGRVSVRHMVSQTAENVAELASDAFHNELVDAINIAAAAYSA